MVLSYVDTRTGEIKGNLPDELRADVVDFFAIHKNDMEEDHVEMALGVWDEMKELGLRLACDCRPGHTPAPQLYAALPAQMRRMPAPPNEDHGPECVFRQRQQEAPDQIILPPRQPFADEDLAIHGPFADPNRNPNPGRGAGGPGGKFPRISRVLFTLLEEAYVNWLFHGQRPTAEQSAKVVWSKAQDMRLCGHGEQTISLGKMLVTLSNDEENIPRIMRLKEFISEAKEWPFGSRPHGFACMMVNNFTYNAENERYELNVVGWDKPLYLETRPYVFAESGRSQRAPYIGIISYALPSQDAKAVYGMRCYLQPCLDLNSWFPVDSGFERETVEAILEWRQTLPEGYTVDIKKPLVDEIIERDGKLRCRPDFILRVKKNGDYVRHVAVETMGFDRIEYEEAKRRTHPIMLMKRGRPLVQHDATRRTETGKMLSKQQFLAELEASVLRGVQPYYDSIQNCPGIVRP